jgi:hypothetical protein
LLFHSAWRTQFFIAKRNSGSYNPEHNLTRAGGTMSDKGQAGGISFINFGCALAMVLSYAKWHSILWAILHGVFNWFYVIYFAIRYRG